MYNIHAYTVPPNFIKFVEILTNQSCNEICTLFHVKNARSNIFWPIFFVNFDRIRTHIPYIYVKIIVKYKYINTRLKAIKCVKKTQKKGKFTEGNDFF